jgi:hypothetical protein
MLTKPTKQLQYNVQCNIIYMWGSYKIYLLPLTGKMEYPYLNISRGCSPHMKALIVVKLVYSDH